MNAAVHPEVESAKTAPLKFAFASGSRPLPGYTIKRGIGRGGFGEVYYALSDAGKEVALKLIRRNLDVELRGVTHCLNLKHPYLLSLFDVKQDDQDNTWVIMEYVSGESLEDVVARHPHGLPPEEAVTWMRGIAAGVAYLHDHGIVHRDLKPGNIFSEEGIVKLGDYGLAKFISCSRRSGQTESVGTVHYMAPEVANGRYGKEIDIYALGIILYEMLTGRVPFEGESVGEVLMKHLTADPDLTVIAEPYRTIVGKTLAKDPETRYQSVEELLADLPEASHKLTPLASAGYVKTQPAAAKEEARGQAADGASDVVLAEAAKPAATEQNPLNDAWNRLATQWSTFNTPVKVMLVILGIFAVERYGGTAVPARMLWLGAALLIYLAVRGKAHGGGSHRANTLTYAGGARPVAPEHAPTVHAQPSQPAAAERLRPVAQGAQVSRRHRWRDDAAAALIVKSVRDRLTELTGSMLLSAFVVAALGLLGVLLRGNTPEPEQYAWLGLTSLAGTWAVLITGKFWEGAKGDEWLRRFIMLVIGLGWGAAAYGLDLALYVDLPQWETRASYWARSFYDSNGGSPMFYAYLGYFGFVMVLVRWWHQADPLRSSRLSLWSTATCTLVAWLVSQFVWSFPQPWGIIIVATMSVAVQLASPWQSPAERRRVA